MADTPKAEDVVTKPGALRDRIVGLERLPASELAVHPKNWRQHPEGQRSALLAAMETIGVADAVLAYKSERNGGQLTLIDGHLRKEILSGDIDVPVLVTDLNDDEADVLLASHDVITTMATRDEEVLNELLSGVEMSIPRDLLLAIDPDMSGDDMELLMAQAEDSEPAKYPILPEYDEAYDSLIVFATREADWAWLEKEFDLPTLKDRKRIGLSHVLTVQQFRERWEKNGSQP